MDVTSLFPTQIDTFWTLVNKRATPAAVSGETFDVPGSSAYDYVLIEVPQSGSLSLAGTPAGGAGSFTLQDTVPTASGEVQVNYLTGRLTFHSTDAGTSVSADYTGLGSAFSVERLLKAYNAIIAVESALGAGVVPTGYSDLKDYLDAELGGLLAEATDPVSKGITIRGGACFISRQTRVTLATTAIDLTTGTYQFPSSTLNFYRKALFTINEAGTVNVYWSAENAVSGSVVSPSRPVNEFPIALVLCRNDGTATTAGKVNTIAAGDVTDMRHVQSLEFDSETQGLIVEQKPTLSDQLNLWGGTFFRRSAAGVVTKVARADYVLDLGTGGAEETAAITASHWNAMLVTINAAGSVVTYEGTSHAVKDSVVLPQIPRYDELPIAIIYFQDNGSAGAGTIANIPKADIYNLIPVRLIEEEPTATTPDLEIDDVDDVRVLASDPVAKTVEVSAGRIMGSTGSVGSLYAGETIDFGSGTHQKTVTGTNWLPVVLTLTRDLATIRSYNGTAAASKGASTAPRPPNGEILLALVYLQGDGTGLAGGIEDVLDADIVDLREFLRGKHWFHDQHGLRVRQSAIADTSLWLEPGHAFFDSPAYVQVSSATEIDVASLLAIALSPGFYKWILITLDDAGAVAIVEPAGLGAAVSADAPMPELSTVHRNLAMVLVQDDGSGVAGAIEVLTDAEVFNLFQPVIARRFVEDWFAVDAETTYEITHNLGRLPHGVTVLFQTTASGGADDAVDISQVHGLPFLNSGFSVVEITSTTLKVRTATYVQACYDASGTLTQETEGWFRVVVT